MKLIFTIYTEYSNSYVNLNFGKKKFKLYIYIHKELNSV